MGRERGWFHQPRFFARGLQKITKLIGRQAGRFGDAAHRDRIDGIVSWYAKRVLTLDMIICPL